jgi:hypothetical protein
MSRAKLATSLFDYVKQSFDEFDPRYDQRVGEQQRLQDLIVEKMYAPQPDVPQLKLSDLEGRDFITSMSDRTDAGGVIQSINGVELASEQPLLGGQDFMFWNPGKVWASQKGAVTKNMNAAEGDDVLFIPWRMAPTGSDFSSMTGGTMIRYAQSNMDKATKKHFDAVIRGIDDSWAGLDSEDAVGSFQAMPDKHRKAIKSAMDVQFRNRGGLNIGEARLSIADPRQTNARDAGIMNVGELHGSKPVIIDGTHPDYSDNMPGVGLGTLEDQPMTIFDLIPDARIGENQRRVGDAVDPLNPADADIRAMQMKPYRGTITPEILKKLQDRGVDVGSINPALLAVLAAGSTSLFAAPLLVEELMEE